MEEDQKRQRDAQQNMPSCLPLVVGELSWLQVKLHDFKLLMQ